MKNGRASQTPSGIETEGHVPEPTLSALGKLSRIETVLYIGARRIDLAIDAVRDRPMVALAAAAAALSLVALLPYR